MTEAERFNINLFSGSGNKKSTFKKVTLKNIFEEIDSRTLPENVKENLKNKAKNYPYEAFKLFLLSLDRHISEEINNNIKNNSSVKELEFPD